MLDYGQKKFFLIKELGQYWDVRRLPRISRFHRASESDCGWAMGIGGAFYWAALRCFLDRGKKVSRFRPRD